MPEPRLLSRKEAAHYCGLSVGSFNKAVDNGDIKVEPRRIGHRVLYDRHAIDRALDALSGLGPSSPAKLVRERLGHEGKVEVRKVG